MLGRKLRKELLLDSGKRLDLFDSKTNVGIEYCGLYWHHEHSPTSRLRNYHYDKMLSAQREGYRVITVFEDEYLERKSAVLNRLLAVLGHQDRVLQARKCSVKNVDVCTAKEFLNAHHVQGAPHAVKCAFGLYNDKELVGVVTGGAHHRQGHDAALVLSRLCFYPGTHVIGGT